MDSLTFKLVVGQDGAVNESATLEGAQSALRRYIAQREVEVSTIASAVQDVFDAHSGRLTMPFVAHAACAALNTPPESFRDMEEKVKQYIRDNTGTQESGATFSVSKGRLKGGASGGVARWSDLPAEPAQ